MRNKIGILITVILIILLQLGCQGGGAAEVSAPAQTEAVQSATAWLVREFQNDDGGYAALSSGANASPSTVAGTLDAILAIAAGGNDPDNPFPDQESTPIQFLRDFSADLGQFAAENGGQAGKVVMALSAAGLDPRAFEGTDYVAILLDQYEPSGGYSAGDAFKQATAILGVAASGEVVPEEALVWLEATQADDGSWDDGFGTLANPDATAMAVMALLAGGRSADDATVQDALAFLAAAQTPTGWTYAPGLTPSANSTAVVIQALSAAGEEWQSADGPWAVDGRSPLDMLLAYQSPSGAFQADFGQGPFDDFYATVQAIPALAGRPFPLPPFDGVALVPAIRLGM